jgi:hypothetical protein
MSSRPFFPRQALLTLAILVLGLWGCGEGASQAPPPELALVAPEILAGALPESIGEWRLGSVDARLIERNERSVRVAGNYTHAALERPIFFELLDCLEAPSLKGLFDVTYDTEVDGYFRIEPQGHPGVQIVSKTPLSTGVKVMVEGRFLFTTSGEGLDVETMGAFVAGFDFNRIAELQ